MNLVIIFLKSNFLIAEIGKTLVVSELGLYPKMYLAYTGYC